MSFIVRPRPKLVAGACGVLLAGLLALDVKRMVWQGTAQAAENRMNCPHKVDLPEPVDGVVDARQRQYLIHNWNEAVDATLKPLVKALSDRNW